MYGVRILDAATRDLARLDKPVGRRIVRKINWLAANLDDIDPEPLSGDFGGLFKLRIGDYRVVYDALYDERLIVIHAVGHRREIYRKKPRKSTD